MPDLVSYLFSICFLLLALWVRSDVAVTTRSSLLSQIQNTEPSKQKQKRTLTRSSILMILFPLTQAVCILSVRPACDACCFALDALIHHPFTLRVSFITALSKIPILLKPIPLAQYIYCLCLLVMHATLLSFTTLSCYKFGLFKNTHSSDINPSGSSCLLLFSPLFF